ncbi:phage tail spike protein [Corynebacterium jeikeium]|uniref:phage tail spike protein n=1 Tax=Actinomycetes TaxID=1760 RepID=UPI0001B7172F|nr:MULTISPECIES: phage tail spike protein [Actinomycetes]EEW16057.1 phage minor structural protein, N-terminal domain protein [Corynebacterium jeikeium ATCC 43734]MDK8869392.1 phage tail spike protein [Corynebacterium macclintockiae]WCZ53853.1 Prophage endopeptidase tail [Corynebacterium jeikeium]SUY80833.1 phage endopeptidase [Corynebacterium jeikeium]
MLTVHASTATTFTATGEGVLDPELIDARVVEELGGAYQLTVTYPADGPLASKLVVEAIIAAPVPGTTIRQGFRIHEVTTSLDRLLEVTAFHLFYDLAGNFIADTFVVNKTPKAALDQLLGAATTKHRFTATSSDTATRASARVVRMNLAAAIMDQGSDNTFASRWAGELTRDNWHIHHAATRGADRGVVIRDRKNLTGYTSTIDLTSVVTRIVPVGFDGITLPELYVDSPHVDHYAIPHIKVMRYPDIKAIADAENPREDEVPLPQAHALLRQAAKAEYATNHVDTPAASYTVSFVDLASTSEYADLAELETVLLGDTVTVQHADLGVSLSARVVGYEYDPLRQAYVSVELGSVAGKFTSITRTITTAQTAAQMAADLAGVALASADGKSTNHYGPKQPAAARLGDTWFKDNGESIEIWIYQLTDTGEPGWVALATDLNHAQVSAELAEARAEVEAAKTAAEEAQAAAAAVGARLTEAEAEIGHAREAASQAEATAQQVQQAAAGIDERLGQAEDELDQAVTAVAGLDSQLATTHQIASQAARELVTLDARLDGIDQQVGDLAADAQEAHNAAAAAANQAQQASTRAARAAGIADGKADVLIQTGAPAQQFQKATTLWIDTTSGANTPKRWNGTAWVAVTDKTARDAATRATQASSAATTAQQRADAAYSLAETKPSDAQVRQLADQAQQAAITAAKADAKAKADQAKADALKAAASDASTKADAAKAQAIAAASQDAAAKANKALADAKAALNAALAAARAEITTEIQNSANGKNTITLSTASPSGSGKRVGDTWWRRSGGVIIGQWSWDGTTWLATQLRHEVIASVDVNALLVTGTARMNEAAVKKIIGDAAFFKQLTTNRLLVSSPDNIIPGGDIAPEPVWWPASLQRVTTDPPPGYEACLETSAGQGTVHLTSDASRLVPVTPGAVYAVEVWLHADKPDSRFYLDLRNQKGAHAGTAGEVVNDGDHATGGGVHAIANQLVPTTWTRFSCRYTMAKDTTQIRLGAAFFNHPNGTEHSAVIRIGGIRVRAMSGATLIEDGAITTDKIAAGAITAATIKAGAVTSDKLTIANGFITSAMIANAAITDAKIANLSASKITTGTLAAARIAAGSITSDKLTIADGFIKTAMIANAAITDAKIGSLSASKITTGTLSAARIAAGSITSDKLRIATGFIQTGMIADAAITSAKIGALDAGKITTGVLSASRIGARSITADKLATNAIQVGLAGWTNSIRISPTQIAWYNGSTLEGTITSSGMRFYYGSRFIGWTGQQSKAGAADIRGISNSLEYTGDYISWSYKTTSTSTTYTTMLTLDPRGKFYGQSGIHLGAALRTHGHDFYTQGNRIIIPQDCTLNGVGTYPGWAGSSGKSKVVFHTNDLYVISGNTFYNMTSVFNRVKDLMSRMNSLISLLNQGWVKNINSGANGNITWNYFSNTGLSSMSTTLS